MNLLPLSVGLGLATSLLMSELLGLASGGLVVPGYLALLVDQPLSMAILLVSALLTWGIVEAIGTVTILFGRRRTTLTLMLGYVTHLSVHATANALPPSLLVHLHGQATSEAVGLIVPGLLALWLSRQGLLETLSALTCSTAVVRLLLILLLGDEVTS